jgi:hypothetical protein
MSNPDAHPFRSAGVPPLQQPAQVALRKAIESLGSQSEAQLRWLGADRSGRHWRVPMMDRVLLVDPRQGRVDLEDGGPFRPAWQILTLHYLDVRSRPAAGPPEITFAGLPTARVYASVYEQRVNRRLCATVGRSGELLQSAATAIGAHPVEGGDLAFDVRVFPRISVRLIWYAGDDELGCACTLLLPVAIALYLSTEDIVVLSEALVSRLAELSP